MLQRESRQERADTLRAGLVASAIYNVHRKKGKPAIQPRDFVKDTSVKLLKPAQLRKALDGWATSHNAQVKRIEPPPAQGDAEE